MPVWGAQSVDRVADEESKMNTKQHRWVAVWSVALAMGAPALGEQAEVPSRAVELAAAGRKLLWLRTGRVDVATRENELSRAAFTDGAHVLVLDGAMTQEQRGALLGAGVVLRGYLPMNAWMCDLGASAPRDLAGLGFVRWVGAYDAAWKIDAVLLGPDGRAWKDPARAALAAKGERFVAVNLFEGAASRATMDALGATPGARVVAAEMVAGAWVVYATLPHAHVAGLARMGDVQFVEEVGEAATRSVSTVRWVVQSDVQDFTPLYNHGLSGLGQVVGIVDDRVPPGHCSFLDAVNPIGPNHRKIVAYNATQGYIRHGAMVADIAVGDGGLNDDTRGVAHGARLAYSPLPSLTEPVVTALYQLLYSQGARVTNNSWGLDGSIAYEGTCRAIDATSFTNDEQLQVFAVTDQFFLQIPENSKSCLAVSASRNSPSEGLMCVGGIGPTSDGRRKPEITAPGCAITASAGSTGCGTFTDTGTSFASPAVSGIGAMAREYFLRGYYPSGAPVAGDARTPSGALLKAVLINSARDMGNVPDFPNTEEGWGRVTGDDALYFAGDARRLVVKDVRNAAGIGPAGSTSEAFVAVRGGAEALKATLGFFDAPAAINASFAPVNDLNLELVAPDGTRYLGNVFSGGVSATGGSADAINSVEQVLIPNPVPGRWRVRVIAQAVNVGPQGFASVVTGDIADVPCPADLDAGLGDGQPDGAVDINDLLYFLALYEQGALGADLDDGTGLGRPDAAVEIGDLLYFLMRYEGGC